MLDMHDKPVTEGARCRFFAETRDTWVEGVVRKVATNGFFLGQARVDDGDPEGDVDCASEGLGQCAVGRRHCREGSLACEPSFELQDDV